MSRRVNPQTKRGRDEDERVLAILAMHAAGWSSAEIGRQFGFMRPEAVRVIIQRVLKADLAESGEPEAVVRAGYRQ